MGLYYRYTIKDPKGVEDDTYFLASNPMQILRFVAKNDEEFAELYSELALCGLLHVFERLEIELVMMKPM